MAINYKVHAVEYRMGRSNSVYFGPFTTHENAEECVIELAGREDIQKAWIEVKENDD